MSYRIAIIGARTTGLAAAGFLTSAGHEVTIIERYATAKPLGAGLLIQPTGLAILSCLGIDHKIIDLGAPIRHLDGRTHKGRIIFDLNYELLGPQIFGLGVHRAALFQVLFDNASAKGTSFQNDCEINTFHEYADGKVSVSGKSVDFGPF